MSEAHYESVLRKLIEEEVSEVQHQLSQGVPTDYPSYRERVGMIRGLETAVAKMTETREKLYGKEKSSESAA